MHEKLVKQLRNTEHCGGCPYDEDCNEFDSCLMDLLAADAIEDLSKRIARQEKELQEKDKSIKDIKYLREFFTKYYKGHCQHGDVYAINNDRTVGEKIGTCSMLIGKVNVVDEDGTVVAATDFTDESKNLEAWKAIGLQEEDFYK